MTVKKSIEDLVIIFKESGLEEKTIMVILRKLGLPETQVRNTLLKLSLLDRLNSETCNSTPLTSGVDDVKNCEPPTVRIDEFNNILKKNNLLLEQLLEIISEKPSTPERENTSS
ncbi:MAG: hypothetical protein QW327_00790 [Candidatus Odinarchaeota archaeon]